WLATLVFFGAQDRTYFRKGTFKRPPVGAKPMPHGVSTRPAGCRSSALQWNYNRKPGTPPGRSRPCSDPAESALDAAKWAWRAARPIRAAPASPGDLESDRTRR